MADELKSYTETLPKSLVKIDMIAVPGGKVVIGDKEIEVKPFFLAKTETTWEAFDGFLSSGPPSPAYDQTEYAADAIARPSKSYILPDLGWGHAGYPVINVSKDNVTMYCRWLSSVTGKKYRVPTEAEWQLAASAPGPTDLDEIAWWDGNSDGTTWPVAKKKPNVLGFHDLFGNVGEWCTALDGEFVLCGGSYYDEKDLQTASARRKYDPLWQDTDPQIPKSRWWLSDGPFVGFRVVCEG